jgi:hypothetical protein
MTEIKNTQFNNSPLTAFTPGVYSGGPHGKRRDEVGHTQDKYFEFLDFIKYVYDEC